MSEYIISVLQSGEIEAKEFLVRRDSMAGWCTEWVYGKGYVTRVIFENQAEAIEFQLKFSDYIDYNSI